MATRIDKEAVITENYAAFESMLPLLLQDHEGEYALMRDREVAGFFQSASAAQFAGVDRYADGRRSQSH
jgi:hypothetical protein